MIKIAMKKALSVWVMGTPAVINHNFISRQALSQAQKNQEIFGISRTVYFPKCRGFAPDLKFFPIPPCHRLKNRA